MQFLFAYPVGGRELIKNIRYNQLGSQTKVVYGNNVVTEYFYGLQQRLRTMTLRRPTNQLFLKNEYWYDRNSNITKFINDTSLSSQLDIGGTSDKSFEYDSYNRLKNATIKWEGMREIHDFKLNMEYNKTHGITSKVQNHRVENVYTHEIRMTDNTFKSNYLYVNAEKPHAVSNIRMVEPNYTSLHNYEYDKNGNLITSNERVGNNSVTRRLYWDDQDRLQAVVDGNEVNFYLYDASGERVIKSFGNAQNLMVNGGHVVGLSTLDDYTVYPSGYLVVGPNKYTKHYYFNNQKIASQTGDSSNFMARANKTVPQNGVLEARTANLQQQMKEVYEGANLDSPTFQARESDWEDDCGHELYDIKKRLLQEKNYDCLNVIKDLESHGLTDCEVLKEYKKAPCYLETACEEEYHQWLDYLQENGKTGCTTILKTLIEEGKSYCDVLYYIEKTTTCFEIITETDCYLEFIELYENCTRANDYLCIKYLQNLMMTSEELDYCDIVEIIKESEFNVIYPPVIPPVDTFPPVEDPVVDPGNPDNETPPVIPDEPIIPEPPFIQGKIWWYHSDHLGSSSYLTDVNGMPTHYYEYLPFGELMVEHNNSNYDNVYKFNAKELDEKTGYYYYGARYYDPRTSLFLSVDPLAEKYPSYSPYIYTFNDPINYIDPDGRDGIRVIDRQNRTITIKAVYYVQTEARATQSGQLPGYSPAQIESMSIQINTWFNEQNLSVTEGDYAGYSIKFDLSFKDGGSSLQTKIKANAEQFEGYSIGNSLERGNEDSHRNVFKVRIDQEGTMLETGGVTERKKSIMMNSKHDNSINRIHEVGHTLGLDDNIRTGNTGGLMEYPPERMTRKEANQLGNGSFLPKVE